MFQLETAQPIPLAQWEDGSIRITGSRVPLYSVIYHFELGATPEQIAYKFQGLNPADIYAVIAYYLNHREEIDKYLREQEAEADTQLRQIESDPNYQREKREFRERLLARWAALQQEKALQSQANAVSLYDLTPPLPLHQSCDSLSNKSGLTQIGALLSDRLS